ncbi:hypothetical protein HYPSUDRAFT_148660 [Hypholoma sublateritium FD-334 SS-4]|uniref:Uncharacterized protein n=1 Tax=Hypholoma sublateritium (strain FD-334 SS-4) TaxID=945553 RepID=A0A0D2P5V5_HYPSF|nr:hypothetical protein HYPSUDRAFT_148660 [Hypholoma sublateritium FD-334 SS-4]
MNKVLQCLACGRTFAQSNAYSIHVGSCRPQRKRMASALELAKETFKRKKARIASNMNPPEQLQLSPVSDHTEVENLLSIAERRPRRERRLPLRFRDDLPVQLPSLPPSSDIPPLAPVTSVTEPSRSQELLQPTGERQILKTRHNAFGLFRQYHAIAFPSHDPDSKIQLCDLLNTASDESFKKLIDIICDQSFDPAEIRNLPWDSLNECLAESPDSGGMWLDQPDAGWRETSITMSIPFPKRAQNPGLRSYTFPPFSHRSIVSVLKEKMGNAKDFPHFHLEPYEPRWQRRNMADEESTRVHGELYTSLIFLEAHEEIQALAPEPGCSLPKVLVGLMFGSDSTHLTAFGNSSLWPCYMYFGNESKYRRCKPNHNLCNHIAYFQQIPPAFKDFAASHIGGKGPSDAFMTHCQREFFHAQWKELLDDEFLEAYEHGVVIECCDGIKRCFYIRIFAYSADYPEKVLLSSIRNMGNCPCPRCLIPKDRTHLLGTKRDKRQRIKLARVDDLRYKAKISSAREIIYQKKHPVDSVLVQRILKLQSLVPTENAFSKKLSPFGFNLYSVFLVDFMHEVELGVWKKVFIHLLRILQCIGGATDKLNKRFCDVPTFGRDSIRRFTNCVSELKKLGARDYENLLQCSIPVFEGLLPEPHNTNLLDVLFALAHWHALAKLRQHTDLSLAVLESATVQLGKLLRKFQADTCSAYDTRELDREMAARVRQTASNSATTAPKPATLKPTKSAGRQHKTLNLNTYKDHSLGDYVESIRRHGTVDSYSTESMELEHRSPKSRYLRTSRKSFEKQLGKIERHQARIRRIRQRLNENGKIQEVPLLCEKSPESSASSYHIGKTQNFPLDLATIAGEADTKSSVKDFTKKLKEHLLPRIRAKLKIKDDILGSSLASSTQSPQISIVIKGERIFNHKVAHFYHTTYDVRRSEDVINPRTSHCDVMLLSDLEPNETSCVDAAVAHPYLYCRVIGIYHANVVYVGPGMKEYKAIRFDFLHVRWFELNISQGHNSDWASLRLNYLSFPSETEKDSYGFVDPSLVLRGCHLIPAFSGGKRHGEGTWFANMAKDSKDWKGYYVNRFADRDMTMRYHWGLGVGHTYSHGRDVRSQQYSAPAEGEDPKVAKDPEVSQEEASEADQHSAQVPAASGVDEPDDVSEPDEPQVEEPDIDRHGAVGDSDSATDDESNGSEDEEELLALHDMYNP